MTKHYADLVREGVPNPIAYLKHVAAGEKSDPFLSQDLETGFNGVYVELAKVILAERGEEVSCTEKNLEASLCRVHERLDCGDFVLPAFLLLLSGHRDTKVIPPGYLDRMEAEVLSFKYWLDEPGVDIHLPCYFTENHQILFHTLEYIAGEMYPDRIFTVNGKSGEWHRKHAEAFLDRWLSWRRRFGFSEWLSTTYYSEDILALATLWKLAGKAGYRKQAEYLIYLLLFDIAVHSFKGAFSGTNGRMYNAPTMYPPFAGTNAVAAYLWGDDAAKRAYTDGGLVPSAIVLAAVDFTVPEVFGAIASDQGKIVEAKQRMSLNVEDSKLYGIDPADFDNIMLYWGLHTFHHRMVIENSRKFCPDWYNMDASIAANLEKFRLMEAAGAVTDQDPNGSALTEVNIYTYRTPDYMLSCAQNYRRGRTNFQQHIWQATLGGQAVVFVTNPGSNDYTGRPNYFVGNGHMPKAAAYKNTLISIHRIPAESTHSYSTHAYFPKFAFDECREENGWLFGRKGEGYIALRSCKQGGSFRPADPALFKAVYKKYWQEFYNKAGEYEFWVPGHANVWVCELGDKKTWGSFGRFVETMSAAQTSGDTFCFTYHSPSQGIIKTGWNLPFTVNGREVEVHGYKRYDNPYCQAEFDTMFYRISSGEHSLTLDFEKLGSSAEK